MFAFCVLFFVIAFVVRFYFLAASFAVSRFVGKRGLVQIEFYSARVKLVLNQIEFYSRRVKLELAQVEFYSRRVKLEIADDSGVVLGVFVACVRLFVFVFVFLLVCFCILLSVFCFCFCCLFLFFGCVFRRFALQRKTRLSAHRVLLDASKTRFEFEFYST